MKKTTLYRLLALFIISYSLLTNLNAQSWQFSKKLGCNDAYAHCCPNATTPPQLLDKLKDSKGNHYLYYYVTGDTFYYDNYNYKRYLRGGDGYALVKINCEGNLQWCKIFTHDKKYQANLQGNYNRAALFFGDNENRIVVSGLSATEGTYFYIDNDTAITSLREYTVIYDSMGNIAKKVIAKPKSQGRSLVTGYFPLSHRYFYYTYIDSTATDRLFFNGKYLPRGEYFILLDSNMNYYKITPVTLFTKPRSLWDTSQPAELTNYSSHLLPFIVINKKMIILNSYYFKPLDLYQGRFVVIGSDTFNLYDSFNNRSINIIMCYNDEGEQEWTRFYHEIKSGNALFSFTKDENEIYLKNDDFGNFVYYGQEINCSLPNGNFQALIFKIDSNGNFLWKDSIEHKEYTKASHRIINDVTYNHELAWNYDINASAWVKVGNKLYQSSSGKRKNLIVAVGKGTQRVIDTTIDAVRNTSTTHVSVDAAENVWLFGSKNANGSILNNDSSAILYSNVGSDLFIAKYGQGICWCDSLKASFTATQTNQEGRITVQYTGTASDSVVYLWGDGSHSIVKPAYTAITKIYNKTMMANITCVAYNPCYRRDTFRKSYPIVCTPPNSQFKLLNQIGRDIRIEYVGTPTDTVSYLWGDGNQTKLANPIGKVFNYSYTTTADSVYISAICKSVCGDIDTFSRWYVFCPKPNKAFTLDTSMLGSRILGIQYTTADSLWVHWGDGKISYKPSGIYVYQSYGVYTVQVIIKSICGRADTSFYTFTLGTSGIKIENEHEIIISPNPAKDYLKIESNIVFQSRIEIQLYDIFGRQINLPPYKREKGSIVLDCSQVPSGIYLLKLENISYKVQIE